MAKSEMSYRTPVHIASSLDIGCECCEMVAMVSNGTSFSAWSRGRLERLSEEGQMSLLVTALFCSIAPATQKGTVEYGSLTSADWSILWT